MRKLKAGRRGNGSKRRLSVERLEARQLLSADLEITGYSQLLIELVNRARANPAGEAALYGINLNQGLPAGTITPTPKQPLAPHEALADMMRVDSFVPVTIRAANSTRTIGNTSVSRATMPIKS